MGYDETLASKIHGLLIAIGPCDRSSMFGAVAFTVNGNIAAGVEDSSVFMRVGEAHAAELLKLPGVKPWPLDGKPQKGWVVLTPNAVAPTVVMRERLGWAYKVAASLPAKEVPRPAAPPPPPPPPPPPAPKASQAPRRTTPKTPPLQPPPPPVTSVIAPGMSRPLAPPSRFPYNPEAARSAPPPLVSKAVKPKTRPPESSERGRLEAGLPTALAMKKTPAPKGPPPSAKPARGRPSAAPKRPSGKPAAKSRSSAAAGGRSAKPARAKVARPARRKPSKPARKVAKQRPAARGAKKGSKKRK